MEPKEGARYWRTGNMFLLRVTFWLFLLVMILPASPDGDQAPPRVGILETAQAARELAGDLRNICDREPTACERASASLTLFRQKLETGIGVVSGGIETFSKSENRSEPVLQQDQIGVLARQDLDIPWSAPIQ